MNPWIWRIIIIIIAIALVPIIVSATATLVTTVINDFSHFIHSNLIGPLYLRGEARLEGLIRLGLYLVFITLIIRILIEMKK